MRERWLFILLCAISVQLIGCEYAVDENRYESKTMSTDPSATQVFHGDETVNGSEFFSGKPKIRRARSTKLEELQRELNISQTEVDEAVKNKDDAKAKANAAKDEETTAKDEWTNALEAVENLEQMINKAKKDKNEAYKVVNDSLALMGERRKDYDNATAYFKSVNETYMNYVDEADDARNNYTAINGKFEEALRLNGTASANKTKLQKAWVFAQAQLEKVVNLELKLKEEEDTLEKYNNATRDLEEWRELDSNKTEAKTKNDKLSVELREQQDKTNKAKERKEKIEKNEVLKEESYFNIRANLTATTTVDEAIAIFQESEKNIEKEIENSKKPNSTADKVQLTIASNNEKARILRLKEIKSFEFPEKKLKKLIDEYANLKKNASDTVDEETVSENNIGAKKNASQKAVDDLSEEIDILLAPYTNKVGLDKLVEEAELKKEDTEKNVKENRKKVEENKAKNETFEREKAVANAKKMFEEANTTLSTVELTIKQVKEDLDVANSSMTDAEAARDLYFGQQFNPMNTKMSDAFQILDQARNNVTSASGTYTTAEENVKALENTRDTVAIPKKESAEKAKNEAAKKEEDARKIFSDALVALENANTKFAEKNKIYQEFAVEEAARVKRETEAEAAKQSTVRTLQTALGSTVGVAVLIALVIVLVFVLRKRQKRKEAEDKPPAKIKFRDECGLMRVQIPGEKDKFQVDGADIKVREKGTTFHRWHNYRHETMNWKHKMDGPEGEGVVKIKKIYFDPEQVEAIPTGEKHDIIEGGDSITEKSGKSLTIKSAKFAAEAPEETAKDETIKKENALTPQSSDERQSGSKSNRANTPSSNPPPSSPSGDEKKKQ